MEHRTIRAHKSAYEKLREAAANEQRPLVTVLDRAIDLYTTRSEARAREGRLVTMKETA